MADATGWSDRTIRNGFQELDDPAALASDRQRKPGVGRKALEALIEPTTRGSLTKPLRWTIKSTARLADELQKLGFAVTATSVRRMLVAMKYSWPGHRKTRQGRQYLDRDGQFKHIAERVKARQRPGEPARSVDTQQQEVLGHFKNPGETYRAKGQPLDVQPHEFPDPELDRAVLHGVYDIHLPEAGVAVGIPPDTALSSPSPPSAAGRPNSVRTNTSRPNALPSPPTPAAATAHAAGSGRGSCNNGPMRPA